VGLVSLAKKKLRRLEAGYCPPNMRALAPL
jgi:hypothetical protein